MKNAGRARRGARRPGPAPGRQQRRMAVRIRRPVQRRAAGTTTPTIGWPRSMTPTSGLPAETWIGAGSTSRFQNSRRAPRPATGTFVGGSGTPDIRASVTSSSVGHSCWISARLRPALCSRLIATTCARCRRPYKRGPLRVSRSGRIEQPERAVVTDRAFIRHGADLAVLRLGKRRERGLGVRNQLR